MLKTMGLRNKIDLRTIGNQLSRKLTIYFNLAQWGHIIANAEDGDTKLSLKSLVPVRLLKNKFFYLVDEAEQNGASKEELIKLLGHGRARIGMFEGDMDEGELEIGQVSAQIKEIKPASHILLEIISEFNTSVKEIGKYQF